MLCVCWVCTLSSDPLPWCPYISIAAQTRALPHQQWTEADLTQIVAAEHHAYKGPVPQSLLPLALCFQVSFIRLLIYLTELSNSLFPLG